MNNKEQLKEIEQKYDMWVDDYNLTPQDVEWLIEQAKRAQVYKTAYEIVDMLARSTIKKANELKQQNKRYREALEFYADERNYEERDFGIIKQKAIQEGDKGNTARQALEDGK